MGLWKFLLFLWSLKRRLRGAEGRQPLATLVHKADKSKYNQFSCPQIIAVPNMPKSFYLTVTTHERLLFLRNLHLIVLQDSWFYLCVKRVAMNHLKQVFQSPSLPWRRLTPVLYNPFPQCSTCILIAIKPWMPGKLGLACKCTISSQMSVLYIQSPPTLRWHLLLAADIQNSIFHQVFIELHRNTTDIFVMPGGKRKSLLSFIVNWVL